MIIDQKILDTLTAPRLWPWTNWEAVEAMPLYSSEKKWSRKAERIVEDVLECGNFGHNRQRKQPKSFVGGKH